MNKSELRKLRDRHGELVDKKFSGEFSAVDAMELASINKALDRAEESHYAPIKKELKAMTKKVKQIAKPFTPRSGMVFKENVARNPRTAVLVEIEQAGRIWLAESVTNRAKFRIPAAKLHGGAYHDGWSKCESADALPKKFGDVAEDEMAGEIFGALNQ